MAKQPIDIRYGARRCAVKGCKNRFSCTLYLFQHRRESIISLINITNLTFGYDGGFHNVFENVSFQIDTDWKLGFTGRNGCGKTTFLNLLMGRLDHGDSISASVSFEYFPYEVTDERMATAEVIKNIVGEFEEWQIKKELNLLQVANETLYRPFDTLSGGERTKVLLAALFLKKNAFLLIDEPTNHLDMRGRQILSEYLRAKCGFILVSHDRAFLDGCIDHILSINRTNIVVQRGNFSSWWHNKTLQDGFEATRNEVLKTDIRRLEKSARRSSDWAQRAERTKSGRVSGSKADKGYLGHKAAKMMKRSKTIESRYRDAINEKSLLLRNVEAPLSLKVHPLKYHTKRMVELENVSIAFGDYSVCEKVNLTIEAGDRIALNGSNGSGKTSIVRLILGFAVPHKGVVSIGNGLKISYISQTVLGLEGSLTDYAAKTGVDETLFKTILHKLGFSRDMFGLDIKDFSPGQKKKTEIARSLSESAHLYIWDEPLNYIDVVSRMQVEELLKYYEPTLLFIEHDHAFCESVATKTVAL